MSLASDNLVVANNALIAQITALTNAAAAGGQRFLTTATLYDNQSSFLVANGYTVNYNNLTGLFKISWDPSAP